MESAILPVREQIDLLLDGQAHDDPCDSYQILDLDLNLPPWYDKDKYKRGQQYIFKNIFAQYGVTLCGLISVLSIPSILTILMNTKKSSTMITAYRRYLSTIKHIYSWYSDELKPGTTAWKSLMTVRARHLRASKTSQRKGGGHISQRDLVLTQFAFYGYGLIRPKLVGMQHNNQEDLEGYIHFWRTIGYLMGIDDKYNICRPSLEETIEITEAICSEAYCPLLQNPPEYFFFMVTELLEGMWHCMPMITTKSFIYFTYAVAGVPGFYTPQERLEGRERLEYKTDHNMNQLLRNLRSTKNGQAPIDNPVIAEEYYNSLSWFDRMVLWISSNVFARTLTNLVGRLYFNFQIKIIMFLVSVFPFLCFYRFGWRKSFVDMFAEDIPEECSPKTNKEMLERRTNCRNSVKMNGKVFNTPIATMKVAKNVNS